MNDGEMQDQISIILTVEGERLAQWERINPHLAVAKYFYIKGLAEAESKVKAKEREIVEWLLKEEFQDAASWMEGIRPKESLNKRLEDWLRKE